MPKDAHVICVIGVIGYDNVITLFLDVCTGPQVCNVDAISIAPELRHVCASLANEHHEAPIGPCAGGACAG